MFFLLATPKMSYAKERFTYRDKPNKTMMMKCKVFRGKLFTPWEKTCQLARDFATRIGRERIVNISNTSIQGLCYVTVWYWEDAADASASSSFQPKK